MNKRFWKYIADDHGREVGGSTIVHELCSLHNIISARPLLVLLLCAQGIILILFYRNKVNSQWKPEWPFLEFEDRNYLLYVYYFH